MHFYGFFKKFIYFYGIAESIHCMAEKKQMCIKVWKKEIHSTCNEISLQFSLIVYLYYCVQCYLEKRDKDREKNQKPSNLIWLCLIPLLPVLKNVFAYLQYSNTTGTTNCNGIVSVNQGDESWSCPKITLETGYALTMGTTLNDHDYAHHVKQ